MRHRLSTPSILLLAICWPAGAALHAEDLRHMENPGEPELRAMQEIPERTTYHGLRGLLNPGVTDEEVRDMRIVDRIGVAYFEEDQIDPARVSVQVDRGTVHLSGEVPSDEARELAERIARATKNVSAVHNELKVSAGGEAGVGY
jgi:hypothetical protein